jgi:hypothetical protein
MLAGFLHVQHITVTCLTSLVSSEVELPRSDFTDRGGSVVPILPEAFGNNVAANSPERQECDYKKSCKSKEMCCVFHSVLIPVAAADVENLAATVM